MDKRKVVTTVQTVAVIIFRGVKRTAHTAFKFTGPVMSGMKGKVNVEEIIRAATKGGVVSLTTWAGVKDTVHSDYFHAKVTVPLASGFVAAVWDLASRSQQGLASGGAPVPPESPLPSREANVPPPPPMLFHD